MSILKAFTKEWKSGTDFALLILRITFAFALVYGHGWDKFQSLFSGQEIQFMDPIGLGEKTSFILSMFAEFICALLLLVGLFTRFALVALIINFIVIVNLHAFAFGDAFGVLEPRIFYLASFIALFLSGAGKHSLDNMLFNKK